MINSKKHIKADLKDYGEILLEYKQELSKKRSAIRELKKILKEYEDRADILKAQITDCLKHITDLKKALK